MLLLQSDSSPFTPDQEQHRTIPAFAGHRQSDDGAANAGDIAASRKVSLFTIPYGVYCASLWPSCSAFTGNIRPPFEQMHADR